MIQLGFTGTREGMTQEQANKVAELVMQACQKDDVTVHHGDCVGADADFHKIARLLGCRVVLHPPTVPDKRAFCDYDDIEAPLDYLERDSVIVTRSDYLIGTPKGSKEDRRSGTWTTIRMGRAALEAQTLKSLVIVYPGGLVEYERH